MYAKVENNHLVYPPHEYVEDGYVYCPPRAEQIVDMGFKPVIDNRPEAEPPQGHWWSPAYTDQAGSILIDYVAEVIESVEIGGEA